MVKGVIFDLDGTLIDTIEGLANSTNFALQKYNLPTHGVEEYRSYVGNGVGKLVLRALPKDKEHMYSKVREAFEENYAETMLDILPIYDGIYDVLDYLRDADIRLAVNTNKLDVFAKPMIERVFEGYFDMVLGETEAFPRKPEPNTVNYIIKTMGIEKSECVFVGDSQVDIETARNAGIFGIAATWGFVKKDLLTEHNPDIMADNPLDLVKIISERNR